MCAEVPAPCVLHKVPQGDVSSLHTDLAHYNKRHLRCCHNTNKSYAPNNTNNKCPVIADAIKSRQISGLKVNTGLKKIRTQSHAESFLSALRGQTSSSNIKEENQRNKRKTKVLGRRAAHGSHWTPAAAPCARAIVRRTWPGTSTMHTCSSRKPARGLVARCEVYPQGCKSEMLGPAQSQNTCLWDIQTAWNRGHRGPIRNSILAL